MNQIEAARLAAALNALRPDWPKQSILTLLHQIAGWSYRDAALQLVFLACDQETKTPGRVTQDGPWRKLTKLIDGENAPQPQPYQPTLGTERPPLTEEERDKSYRDGPAAIRRALQARKETVQ